MWSVLLAACAPPLAEETAAPSVADTADDTSPVGPNTGIDTNGESGDDTAGDTADTSPYVEDAIVATIEPVGTGGVARVTWTTPEASDGVVRFGQGVFDHLYPTLEGAQSLTHSALVVGLATGAPWQLQAFSTAGHHTWVSQTVEIPAPVPPDTLAAIHVDDGMDPTLGGLILTSNADIEGSVMLLDRAGRYVWWHTTEFQMLALQTQLSTDGTHVEWLEDDSLTDVNARFHSEALDGTDSFTFPVPYGHHSFVALPEGGWAFIEMDVRDWEGQAVNGDRIVEFDAAGNELREVWSAWDDFSPPVGFSDPGGEWTHFNGLQYVPEEDAYLVSVYVWNAAVLIDRSTGAIRWQLGGDTSDYAFDEGDGFARIHQAKLLDTGNVLLFDNGDETTGSEAVEYALDESAGTATRVFTYDAAGAIYGNVRGNAERLADGDTFITWGSASILTEVAPDGTVRWQGSMLAGATPGFSNVCAGLGGVGI